MSPNFNENFVTMFAANFSYPAALLQCFCLLNYKIWGMLQERVYKTKIRDIHEVRERSVDEWDKLDQRFIDKVVGEWQKKTSSLCDCRRRTD